MRLSLLTCLITCFWLMPSCQVMVCGLLRYLFFPLVLSHIRVYILLQLIQHENGYPCGFYSDLNMMSGKRDIIPSLAHRGSMLPRLAHSPGTLVLSFYLLLTTHHVSFSFPSVIDVNGGCSDHIFISRVGTILIYHALMKAS